MNAQTPQVLVEDGIPASGKIKDPCLVKTAVQSRGGRQKSIRSAFLYRMKMSEAGLPYENENSGSP